MTDAFFSGQSPTGQPPVGQSPDHEFAGDKPFACQQFEQELHARLDARRPLIGCSDETLDEFDGFDAHRFHCDGCAAQWQMALMLAAFGNPSRPDCFDDLRDASPRASETPAREKPLALTESDVVAPAGFMADVLRAVRLESAAESHPLHGVLGGLTSHDVPGHERPKARANRREVSSRPPRSGGSWADRRNAAFAVAGTLAAGLLVVVLIGPRDRTFTPTEVAVGEASWERVSAEEAIDVGLGDVASRNPVAASKRNAAGFDPIGSGAFPGEGADVRSPGQGVFRSAAVTPGAEGPAAISRVSPTPMTFATERLLVSLIEGRSPHGWVEQAAPPWVTTALPESLPTLDPTDWAVEQLARPFRPISRHLSDTLRLFQPSPPAGKAIGEPAASRPLDASIWV